MQPSVFQLRIDLVGAKPPIWRRILIASNASLYDLHCAIQNAMGWEGYHLHLFQKGQAYYGVADDEFFGFGDYEEQDEKEHTLEELFMLEGDRLHYEYDFGDSWEHRIKLEKILPYDPKQQLPICIKGRNACPPEDVGGLWGYYSFLDVISDPHHPEHSEMIEWVGGAFDPTAFDLEQINMMMAEGCIEFDG